MELPVYSHNPYQAEKFPLLVLNVQGKTCTPSNEGFLIPHWHEEIQFVYVLKGSVRLKVYHEEIELKQGNSVFINRSVLHHITGNEGCHYHSYIIPPKMLSFFPGSTMEANVEQVINNPSFTHYILMSSVPANQKFFKILKDLDALYFENTSANYHEYCISIKLAQIWLEFMLIIPVIPSQLHSKNYTRIRTLVSFIHTNYSQPLSSSDIAASAHISQTECVRCFQTCLGESPYQYLIKYRLHMSTSLLISTDKSVTEIALSIGFHSTSSYIRYFKKNYEMTPAQYRKEFQKTPYIL